MQLVAKLLKRRIGLLVDQALQQPAMLRFNLAGVAATVAFGLKVALLAVQSQQLVDLALTDIEIHRYLGFGAIAAVTCRDDTLS